MRSLGIYLAPDGEEWVCVPEVRDGQEVICLRSVKTGEEVVATYDQPIQRGKVKYYLRDLIFTGRDVGSKGVRE